jgi:hypothetical protein
VLSFALKPIIFREYRIEALSELCNSLLYMMNPTAENDSKSTSSLKAQTPGGTDPIKFVVENILRDAQSRLIYRAGDIIQEDIRQFNPRDQELLVLARGPGCITLLTSASTFSCCFFNFGNGRLSRTTKKDVTILNISNNRTSANIHRPTY